jgi:archaellum component FlaC
MTEAAAREEIRHLAAKVSCLEEEKTAMLAAFEDEKRAIIEDLHEQTRRLEIEVERRSRELAFMEEQRKELTQEVGVLHMKVHRMAEEIERLHGDIYQFRSHEDREMATAINSDSPVRMGRIVPHDKASERGGGVCKGGL